MDLVVVRQVRGVRRAVRAVNPTHTRVEMPRRTLRQRTRGLPRVSQYRR